MTAHAGGDAVSEGLASAIKFDGSIFSQITKAWSGGGSGGSDANAAVSSMGNLGASAAMVAKTFDGANPFQLTTA